MAERCKITVNGRTITARRGEVLLDAALGGGARSSARLPSGALRHVLRACGVGCRERRRGSGARHRARVSVPGRWRCSRRERRGGRRAHRQRCARLVAAVVCRCGGSRHSHGSRAAASSGAIRAGPLRRISEPPLQHHAADERRRRQSADVVSYPVRAGRACDFGDWEDDPVGAPGVSHGAIRIGVFQAQSAEPKGARGDEYRALRRSGRLPLRRCGKVRSG